MKIVAVRAQAYRTLEDFKIEFRPNYCALSGRNNAGKSTIISIIQHFLDNSEEYRYFYRRNEVSFSSDVTQWQDVDSMSIEIDVDLNRYDDSELYFFVDKFSPVKIIADDIVVSLKQTFEKGGAEILDCSIDGHRLDTQTAREIQKKFKASANLIVHNSTHDYRSVYYGGSGYAEVLETQFSADDRKRISEAQTRFQNTVKRAAKQHKEDLDKLLGRLSDKFQVELTSLSSGQASKYPLAIKLTDKRVDISLRDWGAGTQNRTRILISVLEAMRMRSVESAENRLTPVFIVEEPESFLHPSAQSEFGQMLNELASELDLQIVVTTHSPYMLNQSDPSANYLLERKMFRNVPKETVIIPTDGDRWMLPFADNLGIVPKEFGDWSNLFGTHAPKVVLVEGDIDRAYFEHIRSKYPNIYQIPVDVQVVDYGGKDALKNTSILQFMINRFSRVYITYDLDAELDVKKALERIGLEQDRDFSAIGIAGAGTDCIEGLLPASVKQKVFADNFEIVVALGSQDSNARRNAKATLKKKYLEEFTSQDIPDSDLSEFKKVFAKIARAFI
ncbi:ATP-binding protein [Altererythrobacter sp. BO-6]|uniref:ATP-dependent nuclease n=1 Tax=Altererythrobacter sp. BO-6 TaxID=2604537 RepID=UPI0013E1587E|nr:AAA family ATPase [Altererythrobacter sp. BO-6]QIG55161.1 ATP-binding protein [Altererythrobacter sp. BO-6]